MEKGPDPDKQTQKVVSVAGHKKVDRLGVCDGLASCMWH